MSKLRHLARNEEGQSILIVVIFLVVLLGFCALTIDVGHAYLAQRRLQASVDAAALAGADSLPDTAAAQAGAADYGNGGVKGNSPQGVQGVSMTIATKCLASVPGCTTANAVTVKETGTVQTAFGGLFGIGSFTVHASATACSPCGSKPLDIMLLFDRTGSMCDPDCSAFSDAKTAMQTFLTLMDPTLDKVGLAVLPPAPAGGGACDAPKSPWYTTPDDPYILVPPSYGYANSKGVLNGSSPLVSALTGNCLKSAGSTSYANALEAAQTALANDGDAGTQKVIVFMSDGAANTGPTSYPDSSPYRKTPCHQGINSASVIKSSGTIVYSIGFGVGYDADNVCRNSSGGVETPLTPIQAEDALKGIASPGNYYATADSDQLSNIYASVAADLLQGTSRLVNDNS